MSQSQEPMASFQRIVVTPFSVAVDGRCVIFDFFFDYAFV